MHTNHEFKVAVQWRSQNIPDRKTIKNHIVHISNKPDLQLSAAKGFKGDERLYNPEDLLLSSLASCHMMSYLYCCLQHNIEVVSYTDEAIAYLEVYANGSGRISKVVLQPVVTITNVNQIDLALSLHKKANELCFIANSCNFIVTHQSTCTAL